MLRSPQLGANGGVGLETRLHQSVSKADARRTGANLACCVRVPAGPLVAFDQLPDHFENLICTKGLGQHGVRAQAPREVENISRTEQPASGDCENFHLGRALLHPGDGLQAFPVWHDDISHHNARRGLVELGECFVAVFRDRHSRTGQLEPPSERLAQISVVFNDQNGCAEEGSGIEFIGFTVSCGTLLAALCERVIFILGKCRLRGFQLLRRASVSAMGGRLTKYSTNR